MTFASNDLVNFIGVPLAGLNAFQSAVSSNDPMNILMTALSKKIHTPTYIMLIAGGVMVLALWTSRKARTVTETEIRLGQQDEGTEKYESIWLSRKIVNLFDSLFCSIKNITPHAIQTAVENLIKPVTAEHSKLSHAEKPAFDLVRASVNLMVATAVVSMGTSLKLPLSTTYVTFMVAMGISSAATIRVSNAVGRQDIHGTRRAGFSAVILCPLFMASAGLVFIIFRFLFPTFYIGDKAVIDMTASLLIIVAFFQVSDGTQAVGIGILRGITDMKIPTLITLVAYWVMGLPSGYILAFGLDMGIFGVWYGLFISLTASGLFMMMRFNAKSKKVVLHP